MNSRSAYLLKCYTLEDMPRMERGNSKSNCFRPSLAGSPQPLKSCEDNAFCCPSLPATLDFSFPLFRHFLSRPEMASNILPLFWNLASSSKDTRIAASAELIESLEGFQQSFLATRGQAGPSSDEDDEDDDDVNNDKDAEGDDTESEIEVDGDDDDEERGADQEAASLEKALVANNAEDVVYTIRRLVRGLGSSRENSRLGYAVALTEVCHSSLPSSRLMRSSYSPGYGLSPLPRSSPSSFKAPLTPKA